MKSKMKEQLAPEILERRRRVAYHIKRLRFARGIKTAEDLAGKMEMNPGYMRRLESGHAPFGSDMEQRFTQFFGVDFTEFYKPIPISEADIEMAKLQEKVRSIGGTEKIRQLSKIADALLGGWQDDEQNEGEGNEVPPSSRKKR